MATNTSPETTPTRRLYQGSCHCKLIKYAVYLTLPPVISTKPPPTSIRIYKCNCTTCQKMGIFHVRLIDAPEDFYLFNPLNLTEGGMKDYRCFSGNSHWYFCGNCGVRCFTVAGQGSVKEVEIEGEKKQAWRIDADGWRERGYGPNYFSLNALTLEPHQEGLDLREWTEKGWVAYYDSLEDVGEYRLGEPHTGGMY
jgi:hypothetical protein